MSNRGKNWFFLFVTNFLGVFNDNFLKHCIVFIAVLWIRPTWLTQSQLTAAVSAALVLPYLLLSPAAAALAMRYSHKQVLRVTKLAEIPIMLVACAAFYLQNVWLALVAVLLMGTQSALYSPAKYSLIRDIGGSEGASFGSGMFESVAFFGILLGTVTASFLSEDYHMYVVLSIFLIIALLGYIGARSIKCKEQAADEQLQTIRPVKFIRDCYRFARNYPRLNLGVFGAAFLWFIGSLIQMNLIIYCRYALLLSNVQTGYMVACAAIGIAIGCGVTGYVSGKKVRYAFIPIGLSLVIVPLAILLILRPSVTIATLLIVIATFGGGMFEVPCLAIVQNADIGRHVGDMVAYTNLVTFLFILLGSALFSLITHLTGEDAYAVFALILVACIVVLCIFSIILYRKPHQSNRI